MNHHVLQGALIETWEPDMGFLTKHNCHFYPSALLNNTMAYIWLNGQPPVQRRGRICPVGCLFPAGGLAARYKLVTSVGECQLYQLRSGTP